jgi:hypothetical protein
MYIMNYVNVNTDRCFCVCCVQYLAAPPILLGEIAPFVVWAWGIFLGVFSAGKGENEVKIL